MSDFRTRVLTLIIKVDPNFPPDWIWNAVKENRPVHDIEILGVRDGNAIVVILFRYWFGRPNVGRDRGSGGIIVNLF